jgi:hypothetical protein
VWLRHKDVQAAKRTQRLHDRRRDIGGLRHVDGAVSGLHHVLGLEFVEELVDQRGIAESVRKDVGAVCRERARDTEADAARRASQQRCLFGQYDRFLLNRFQSLQSSKPSSGKDQQTVGIRSPFGGTRAPGTTCAYACKGPGRGMVFRHFPFG